jgi:hypothetical protein
MSTTKPLAARALDHADHRLPAGVDMDVLDRDFLLAPLAAVAVERLDQSRVGARELVGLVQVLAPALKGLVADHCAFRRIWRLTR